MFCRSFFSYSVSVILILFMGVGDLWALALKSFVQEGRKSVIYGGYKHHSEMLQRHGGGLLGGTKGGYEESKGSSSDELPGSVNSTPRELKRRVDPRRVSEIIEEFKAILLAHTDINSQNKYGVQKIYSRFVEKHAYVFKEEKGVVLDQLLGILAGVNFSHPSGDKILTAKKDSEFYVYDSFYEALKDHVPSFSQSYTVLTTFYDLFIRYLIKKNEVRLPTYDAVKENCWSWENVWSNGRLFNTSRNTLEILRFIAATRDHKRYAPFLVDMIIRDVKTIERQAAKIDQALKDIGWRTGGDFLTLRYYVHWSQNPEKIAALVNTLGEEKVKSYLLTHLRANGYKPINYNKNEGLLRALLIINFQEGMKVIRSVFGYYEAQNKGKNRIEEALSNGFYDIIEGLVKGDKSGENPLPQEHSKYLKKMFKRYSEPYQGDKGCGCTLLTPSPSLGISAAQRAELKELTGYEANPTTTAEQLKARVFENLNTPLAKEIGVVLDEKKLEKLQFKVDFIGSLAENDVSADKSSGMVTTDRDFITFTDELIQKAEAKEAEAIRQARSFSTENDALQALRRMDPDSPFYEEKLHEDARNNHAEGLVNALELWSLLIQGRLKSKAELLAHIELVNRYKGWLLDKAALLTDEASVQARINQTETYIDLLKDIAAQKDQENSLVNQVTFDNALAVVRNPQMAQALGQIAQLRMA